MPDHSLPEYPLDPELPVRSVVRAVDVLLALADGPQALTKVATTTNLPKATVHRILASLSHRFLVLQEPDTGKYALGPGCLAIINAAARGSTGLGIEARNLLELLQRKTGETVTVHVRVRSQRVCVDEIPSKHLLRYTVEVGRAAPLHVGAAGKVLLAYLDPRDRHALLHGRRLAAVGPNTITTPSALSAELETIRVRGYGISRGERVNGASAISAPIFDPSGQVMAVLSVLGPDVRLTAEKLEETRDLIVAVARQISMIMRLAPTV